MSEHSRPTVVAANWKMNLLWDEAIDLVYRLSESEIPDNSRVILGVPYIYINKIAGVVAGNSDIFVAAQNCHSENSGAYTGEISASMLKSVSCDYVILGHSERRQYFGEEEAELLKKVRIALQNDLKVIFCLGERLEERENDRHLEVVENQLKGVVLQLDEHELAAITIAYEPVWAIGTGKTASPAQAQQMHRHIRDILQDAFGDAAEDICILYGGSVKPGNAAELFSQPDIDGGLVGGASLKFDSFEAIVKSSP